MLVNELISKFDFHDSNVIALHHKENNLVIKLDLCMWKQKNYNEGDDELKEVFIEFTNVEKYVWDSEKAEEDIDYETILDFSYDGKSVKIVFGDEDICIMDFECSWVEFVD